MECIEKEEYNPLPKNSDSRCPEPTENFQKFIYELFEKNGILNELRAYLRGQIVNVLKCSNTGESLPCQKHFTQRLELTYQAINILIAEYFLKLEFNYALSVFVSEIPLANMIFDFTKTLLNNTECTDLSFGENDVWSILSCLGIKCDSEYACRIVDMYKSERIPLLLSILKCMSIRKESMFVDNVNTSEENIRSDKSTETLDENFKKHSETRSRKCKHYAFCKTCQNRTLRLKEKYGRRKTRFVQNTKKPSADSLDVGSFMKNLSVVEHGIISEMFEQLKSVYETEVEMIREEQENKIKKSIANHAMQLQKHREELEESFKERELELYRSVDEKKKFLWNLAKSLRQQHEHMSRAMEEVKGETERLNVKESNLKTQIQEAEELLRKRGEDMRNQISDELQILDQHLQSMKKERDSINVERVQLEKLKETYTKSDFESDNVKREYGLLRSELQVLRQFVESANVGKSSAEKATITESLVSNLMNNEQLNRGMNKVNNDLKQKIVNLNMMNDEMYRDFQRPSRSSVSSDDRGQSYRDHVEREPCCGSDSSSSQHHEMERLRNENQRLNILARQQSDHIASLAGERTRLQSALNHSRPQTAPTAFQKFAVSRSNQSANNAFVSTIGGGEQLNVFPETRPRVLIPSDALPFIGVLRDRHTDSRRHLISQWRSLRRRVAPQVAGSSKVAARDGARGQDEEQRENTSLPFSPDKKIHIEDRTHTCSCEQPKKHPVSSLHREADKQREKSPKSMLREAKEKLRNNNTKDLPTTSREKSPNTTLREAKLRLRKLEIEADAVERSYQDFRRRQREEKLREGFADDVTDDRNKDLGIKRSKSLQKLENPYKVNGNKLNFQKTSDVVERDFDKYLKEYQTNFQMSPFRNKNAMSEMIKPIPVGFSEVENQSVNRLHVNYLETPLTEFRKLYHTKKTANKTIKLKSPMNIVDEDISSEKQELKQDESREAKTNVELEILKDNINKIYNLSPKLDTPVEISGKSDKESVKNEDLNNVMNNTAGTKDMDQKIEENLLRVDIENVVETNSIKMDSEKHILVLVESSIKSKEIESDNDERDKISTQMTILVSPKDKSEVKTVSKSSEIEKLTDNDLLDAIYHAEANKEIISSVDMQYELSKIESLNDKDGQDEYPDDFSADVDNYNSRSDYEHSPISIAKDSQDNFWDS